MAAAARRRATRKWCHLPGRRAAEVQTRLDRKHSPEQIARRLRQEFPDEPEMWVSHETIYQSIYVQGRGALRRELAAVRCALAVRFASRMAPVKKRQTRIKDMVLISERPAEVEDRAVPGHWEGDLITGTGEQVSDRDPGGTHHRLRDPAAPPADATAHPRSKRP